MGAYERELIGVGTGTGMNIMSAIPMFATLGPVGGVLALGAAIFGGISGFMRARKRRRRYKAAKSLVKQHAGNLKVGEAEKHGSQQALERERAAAGGRGKFSSSRKALQHKEGKRHGMYLQGIETARSQNLNQLGEAYEQGSGMSGSAAVAQGAMNLLMSGVSQAFPEVIKKPMAGGLPALGGSYPTAPKPSFTSGGGSSFGA